MRRACISDANAADESPAEGKPRRGRAAYIVEELRSGILNGRFGLGQRLIEADLVRDYGVSRGSLREAFRLLSAAGLVELVPNRGAVVRKFSPVELAQIFQIREVLEGLSTRLAAERIREGDNNKRLLEAAKPFMKRRYAKTSASFIEDNRRFHLSIVAIGGNEPLESLIAQMQLPLLMLQLRNSLSAERIERSAAEHKMIAAAILNGKPEAADQAMRAHLRRSAGEIFDLHSANLRPDQRLPGPAGTASQQRRRTPRAGTGK